MTGDETPTNPIPDAAAHLARRRNTIRDLIAIGLLLLAPLFPWNLYFGLGIPGSSTVIWEVLALVTLMSLAAPVLSRAHIDPVVLSRLRLGLNVPYLLLIGTFIAYNVFESIMLGGTVGVPGGIGPGGWLGFAGALLSAQPVFTSPVVDEVRHQRWLRAARFLGYTSIAGAVLGAGFNLAWRLRYALQGITGTETFGTRNIAVILTATVYGLVALTAVVVASYWSRRNTKDSRLVTGALAASTLVAGMLVWTLPVGREIDAFHGIAQNTTTAGVGYEGYLAWTGTAALFLPLALFSSPETRADRELWRNAIRKALALIGVWCLGSVLMRMTDFVVAVILNYPYSRYDTMTLAAFDLTTAALAWWLRAHLSGAALRSRLTFALSGFLFTLTVSRVFLGVMLAPRFEELPGVVVNRVYGNNLAQQITSTFDVALCGVALCVFIGVIIAGRIRRPRRRPPGGRPARPPAGGSPRPAGGSRPPAPAGPSRSPRIARPTQGPRQPRIHRPPGTPA
ncbi:hypothetical protein [Mycobacterium sp.]|uniref:DUF7937 domain-containing protein n=1 Tax=Mycobacterium sp. TaxID=1785 RepID=UPI003A887064